MRVLRYNVFGIGEERIINLKKTTQMILFKQQAYYIGNENVFFVAREKMFNSKEEAMRDLESFACRTKNRIPNKSYKCVVFETPQIKTERTITDELADRICY